VSVQFPPGQSIEHVPLVQSCVHPPPVQLMVQVLWLQVWLQPLPPQSIEHVPLVHVSLHDPPEHDVLHEPPELQVY